MRKTCTIHRSSSAQVRSTLPGMATPQQRRVLVVEDDETIARAVRHRLVAEGFEVQVAGDGEAALVAYAKTGPDVVVLDRLLPGLDGLEVCRRMQAARPVPVLMLTALGRRPTCSWGSGSGPTTTWPSRSACASWSPGCTP